MDYSEYLNNQNLIIAAVTEKSDPGNRSEIIHKGYTEDNTAAPDTDQEDTMKTDIVQNYSAVVSITEDIKTEDSYDFYDENNIIDCMWHEFQRRIY